MPRSAASIQTQITAIEAQMTQMIQSVGSNGTSVNHVEYDKLNTILKGLYADLDVASANASRVVRGRLDGMGG